MNIIYSASGVFALFFIVLLLSRQRKKLADYLLVGWFALIFMTMVTIYLINNQLEARALFDLTNTSVYLHGPLLWFYTLSLIKRDFLFRRRDWWHLLPFVFASAYLGWHHLNGSEAPESGRSVILITKMAILPFYGVAILKQLKKYEQKIGDYFSYTEKITLNWLKLLVWSLLVIWTIAAISQLLFSVGGVPIPAYGGLLTNIALSIFVLVVGYFGIRQTTFFVPTRMVVDSNGETATTEEKAPSTAVAMPEDPHFARLLRFMKEQQPHLNGELTLDQLATQAELPSHQLSQLINRCAGTNFFNFVNGYRVVAFQQKIHEKAHLHKTLLAVAEECGFNSKASFNRVFKKMTGQTPRQYVSGHASLD